MIKKALKSVLYLVFTLCIMLAAIPAALAENTYDGHIKIDTLTAINGDTVLIKFKMLENPGIMAMTVSITYDSSALEYKGYKAGNLRDYMFTDHPSHNLIRFVSCDSKNNEKNGRMFTLEFKVKEDADFGSYPISVSYKSGDFCNSDMKLLMPKITAGGINIEYDGKNCRHKKYGEWDIAADPTCEGEGVKQRSCIKCGHIDTMEIPAAGHDFSREWTVDKPATTENSGVMSRHCKNCDAKTDELTFSLKESEQNKIDNKIDAIVKPSDTVDELVSEQLPEVYKENGECALPDPDKPLQSSPDAESSVTDGGKTSSNMKIIIVAVAVCIIALAAVLITILRKPRD